MTTQQEADERQRLERAREIALFRYSLVQEVDQLPADGRPARPAGAPSSPR